MTRRLEIISDVGFFFCVHDCFFSVHISADSCTLNLLYVISKLSCKIDQRELETTFSSILYTEHVLSGLEYYTEVIPISLLQYSFVH